MNVQRKIIYKKHFDVKFALISSQLFVEILYLLNVYYLLFSLGLGRSKTFLPVPDRHFTNRNSKRDMHGQILHMTIGKYRDKEYIINIIYNTDMYLIYNTDMYPIYNTDMYPIYKTDMYPIYNTYMYLTNTRFQSYEYIRFIYKFIG